jgi:hypothetical protein
VNGAGKTEFVQSRFWGVLFALVWEVAITIFTICGVFLTGFSEQVHPAILAGVCAAMVACCAWVGTQLYRKTVTTLNRDARTIEVRKYTFLRRNPEPSATPWDEVADVIIVPSPAGTRYGVWVLLRDKSLILLDVYGRQEKALACRNLALEVLGVKEGEGK